MFRIDFATFLVVAAIYIGMKIASGEPMPSHGPLDLMAFGGFVVFMWWLLRNRESGGDSADGQGADKSIAFRLGKALNGVRRGFRRTS
jgi:cell division protein FtsW (lipid II flippase)